MKFVVCTLRTRAWQGGCLIRAQPFRVMLLLNASLHPHEEKEEANFSFYSS